MLFPKVCWEDHVKSLILFQVMESFVSLVRCDFFFQIYERVELNFYYDKASYTSQVINKPRWSLFKREEK